MLYHTEQVQVEKNQMMTEERIMIGTKSTVF